MGREYSSKRSSRVPNLFLVSTITFLLGYLSATFFDLGTLVHWVNTQVLAHHEANKTLNNPQAQQKTTVPHKPKFEFYTLLTNEKMPNSEKLAGSQPSTNAAATSVSASIVATKTTAADTAANVQQPVVAKALESKPIAPVPVVGKGTYSVQVAAFKARQDAEHMKGLLILKGFNVMVVPISHSSRGIWFRVVVGPYANRTLAQKAQIDLAKNEHLRGMLTTG
ncbi:SPOR domain-containing protein [Legionella sp.]|uniref:SPOR domain-containing protein n=1 Tax=Legionella sp. TaxID=459 RepID=UPI003C98603D